MNGRPNENHRIRLRIRRPRGAGAPAVLRLHQRLPHAGRHPVGFGPMGQPARFPRRTHLHLRQQRPRGHLGKEVRRPRPVRLGRGGRRVQGTRLHRAVPGRAHRHRPLGGPLRSRPALHQPAHPGPPAHAHRPFHLGGRRPHLDFAPAHGHQPPQGRLALHLRHPRAGGRRPRPTLRAVERVRGPCPRAAPGAPAPVLRPRSHMAGLCHRCRGPGQRPRLLGPAPGGPSRQRPPGGHVLDPRFRRRLGRGRAHRLGIGRRPGMDGTEAHRSAGTALPASCPGRGQADRGLFPPPPSAGYRHVHQRGLRRDLGPGSRPDDLRQHRRGRVGSSRVAVVGGDLE